MPSGRATPRTASGMLVSQVEKTLLRLTILNWSNTPPMAKPTIPVVSRATRPHSSSALSAFDPPFALRFSVSIIV